MVLGTFEEEPPKIRTDAGFFSEVNNVTVGSEYEVSCDQNSCNEHDCIFQTILNDDHPFIRTEFGTENVNLYPLVGDPFGRISLHKSRNLTKVVVQVGNAGASGKYSCEHVSLKGYYRDSQYLNVITAGNSTASLPVKPILSKTTELPTPESATLKTFDVVRTFVTPAESFTSPDGGPEVASKLSTLNKNIVVNLECASKIPIQLHINAKKRILRSPLFKFIGIHHVRQRQLHNEHLPTTDCGSCCCVSARMPMGYVMLSVTRMRSVNDEVQLTCSHVDCFGQTYQSLTIFKDTRPFLRKDYSTDDIFVYHLPGSPLSLL
ncbi:unnamed protein product [Allacma fusca]|uniref:Uncharacterized protein n=1 Tax=Allacma fusca TaxID=39272 RepID=A0A8J2KI56_9HEXA|nr:unnamed protein product [Allacma fusca]